MKLFFWLWWLLYGIMDWIMFSQNSHIQAINSYVSVLGDRDFKAVIKVKWGHKDGTLIR